MSSQLPKDIQEPFVIQFPIKDFGLYALKIVARCKSGSVLGFRGGQDLRAEIDGTEFHEIPQKGNQQHNDIPLAWNGTKLKGLAKTIFFILPLDKGSRTLKLIPNKGAKVESFEIIPIKDTDKVLFEINEQAEDGNGRPWYTVALINLPLKSITADATIDWHLFDGDDVKLIIDNEIEANMSSKRWKDWVWHAMPGQFFSGSKREEKVFTKNLPAGIHYIELWADKTPTLHEVILNLGEVELKRIPTKEDPKWTGDFKDDTDAILMARLILGEMEGQSQKAKTGAGFTVLNRLQKKRSNWGYSVREIVLKESQYDAFVNEKTLNKVRDPLSRVEKNEWENCYETAAKVLSRTLTDPTGGATHFYSTSTDSNFPWWATKDVFKIKIGITYFYELES